MASRLDPRDCPMPDDAAASEMRLGQQRASSARLRGHHLLADDLYRDARALAAALAQYQAALGEARRAVSALTEETQTVWEHVATDRTLRDLADDAGVLLALLDDLDRAERRLRTLELTRP